MNAAQGNPRPGSDRPRAVVRWVLGAVFLIAGAMKITHPVDFHSDLLAYEVPLPDYFLRLVAIALPWLEAICGAALLVDFWPETARLLIAAMCFVFVLMLGQAVIRGLDLRCGCFGTGGNGWLDLPVVALGRVILLLAASVWLLRQRTNAPSDRGNSAAQD